MPLSAIEEQLQLELAAVPGVKTAFRNSPSLPPAAADCPAALLDHRRPFLTVTRPAAGILRYTWHFRIRLLFAPLGLDTDEARDAGLEPYPALLVTQLASTTTLNGHASGIDVPMDLEYGIVADHGVSYAGLGLDLDVYEDLTTAMGY